LERSPEVFEEAELDAAAEPKRVDMVLVYLRAADVENLLGRASVLEEKR